MVSTGALNISDGLCLSFLSIPFVTRVTGLDPRPCRLLT